MFKYGKRPDVPYWAESFYWTEPHDNCAKFPYYPEYDVDLIFGYMPIKNGHIPKINRVQYLDKSYIFNVDELPYIDF